MEAPARGGEGGDEDDGGSLLLSLFDRERAIEPSVVVSAPSRFLASLCAQCTQEANESPPAALDGSIRCCGRSERGARD